MIQTCPFREAPRSLHASKLATLITRKTSLKSISSKDERKKTKQNRSRQAAKKRVNLASKEARGTHGQGDDSSKYRGESMGRRHEQDRRPAGEVGNGGRRRRGGAAREMGSSCSRRRGGKEWVGWLVGGLGSGGEVLYVIRWWGAVSMIGGCAADPLHRASNSVPTTLLGHATV